MTLRTGIFTNAKPVIWMTIFPALISVAAGLVVFPKQGWIVQVFDGVLRAHLLTIIVCCSSLIYEIAI